MWVHLRAVICAIICIRILYLDVWYTYTVPHSRLGSKYGNATEFSAFGNSCVHAGSCNTAGIILFPIYTRACAAHVRTGKSILSQRWAAIIMKNIMYKLWLHARGVFVLFPGCAELHDTLHTGDAVCDWVVVLAARGHARVVWEHQF